MTDEVFIVIQLAAVGFLKVVELVVELHVVAAPPGTMLVAYLHVFLTW